MTFSPFSPMRPELRAALFRERRVYGKGGQFAKGGGRVPASLDIPVPTAGAAWIAALESKTKITRELAAEVVARPRLTATGGTPPDHTPRTLIPGSHPVSKGWAKEVAVASGRVNPISGKPDLSGSCKDHAIRARAKALIVKDLSERMVADPEFATAAATHMDAKVLSPVHSPYGGALEAPWAAYARTEGGHYDDQAAPAMNAMNEIRRRGGSVQMDAAYVAAYGRHGTDTTVRHVLEEYGAKTGQSPESVLAAAWTQRAVSSWAVTSSDSHREALAAQLSSAVVHWR